MKTKIGISAGIVAAGAYFIGLLGGWVPVLLIAGYVLIKEENQWLRMSVIKAVVVCAFFAIISTFISFIPDLMAFMGSVFGLFNQGFHAPAVSNTVSILNVALTIFEKVLLLMMGFAALNQGNVKFGVADSLVAKHTLSDDN